MSTQKSMYIIAIVLLIVVSSSRVSAESLVDTSVSIVTETEGMIRNDTQEVEASNSAQQNTEVKKSVTGNISQGLGTGSVLTQVVNALISGTAGVGNEGEDFCKALDATLMKQSDDHRASLAWNASSYEKNINLKYQGQDGSQASLHESSQNTYKGVSSALKNLKPRSDKAIDAVMLSRYQAIARSALVEMNMALKSKEIDSERAESISQLLKGTLSCVDTYSLQEGGNTESLGSVKSTLGEFVAGWDANKNSFGVDESTVVKEAFSLNISSDDELDENEKAPTQPDAVSTKEELSLYVRSILNNDSIIKEVSMSDDTVVVRLASRAKLFGFVPMWISPKVSVNTKGEVSVKYPWYGGISSKKVKFDSDSIKTELVTLGLVAEVTPETFPTDMSMEYRATLVEALNTILREQSVLGVETVQVEEVEISEEETKKADEVVPVEEIIEVAPQA